MDDRKNTLIKLFKEVGEIKDLIEPMIDDVVFLEKKLNELRELPFIKFNPNNSSQQKVTPAAKQYKELLQQYNNCIKILCSVIDKTGSEDISPLRAYLEKVNKC